MLALLGLVALVAGFVLRLNPLLCVALAAAVTGLCAGHGLVATLGALGRAFNADRYVTLVWLILPLIGLLERYGLQDRARSWVARLGARSVGRLLLTYMALRQLTAAVGLTALGGPAAMVRPLLAPLAETAAEAGANAGAGAGVGAGVGPLDPKTAAWVRAHAAAVDTLGLFFGEDVFIAIGSILLIRASLQAAGVSVDPLRLSLWAIPTAVAALVVHGARLLLLDRGVRRRMRAAGAP